MDICSLPKVVGPCEAFIPRWYFDKSVGRCKRFIFGGCQGNQNNFKTPADCVEACGGEGKGANVIRVNVWKHVAERVSEQMLLE